MENPHLKWMMNRGTPILGNPHEIVDKESINRGFRLLPFWLSRRNWSSSKVYAVGADTGTYIFRFERRHFEKSMYGQ